MALVTCFIQTAAELFDMIFQCCREINLKHKSNMKIPKHIVEATVNDEYWRGAVREMFSDGVFTSTRFMVVDKYTDEVCCYHKENHRPDTSRAIRRAHREWLETIKSKTI